MAVNLWRRVANFVVHGGSWRLRPYEQAILDAARAALGDADRRAWDEQLAHLDHVKRLHDDRMVTFHFQCRDALPRLADRSAARCLARLRIQSGEASLRVNVFIHDGLLSSLEFGLSPRAIGDQLSMTLTRLAARKERSIDAELDREEHGS